MERPRVTLPEDKEQFLASVPPEFAPDAEEHWDMLAERDEERERRWRADHAQGGEFPSGRTKEPVSPSDVTVEWMNGRFDELADRIRGAVATLIDETIRARLAASGNSKTSVNLPEEDKPLTTPEAARYLRKSTSWLLKRSDIPYLKGIPNHYRRKDLDAWLQRHRHLPKAA